MSRQPVRDADLLGVGRLAQEYVDISFVRFGPVGFAVLVALLNFDSDVHEWDLVIERDDDIVGIEIKASRHVSSSDTRGLFSLAETIGKYKPLLKRVAYLGDTPQLLDNGVQVCPYLELLDEIYGDG